MKPGQTVFVTIDGKPKKAVYEGPIPSMFEKERERESFALSGSVEE